MRDKRCTLKWDMNSVPIIHSSIARKRPSILHTVSELRKSLKIYNVEPDQLSDFQDKDLINSFIIITQNLANTAHQDILSKRKITQ